MRSWRARWCAFLSVKSMRGGMQRLEGELFDQNEELGDRWCACISVVWWEAEVPRGENRRLTPWVPGDCACKQLSVIVQRPVKRCTAPLQDKLSAITAQYLAGAASPAPRGGGGSSQQAVAVRQLEAYIGECAALLGLRSAHDGSAKEQLAEALEAVVQCKQPDCYG